MSDATRDTNAPESESFEATIEALEKIVTEMESGELPLQAALEKFEQGIALAKRSQAALDNAEQKVKILMQSHQGETLEPFEENKPS